MLRIVEVTLSDIFLLQPITAMTYFFSVFSKLKSKQNPGHIKGCKELGRGWTPAANLS